MKLHTIFFVLLHFAAISLSGQSGKFMVPDSCGSAKTAGSLEECGNYYRKKNQYAESLTYYERLYTVKPGAQLLMRIFDLNTALRTPFDTTRFLKQGNLQDVLFCVKSMNFGGQWKTASWICERAVKIYPDFELKTLWHNVASMGNIPFDMRVLTDLESAEDLLKSAEYLSGSMQLDSLAEVLFARSEKKEHSVRAVIGMYNTALKQKKPFDTRLFEKSKNNEELFQYANYLTYQAESMQRNKDKVPYYKQAVLLLEKYVKTPEGKGQEHTLALNYSNLAYFMLFEPDAKNAEIMVRKAIKLRPSLGIAYTNLAPALLLQGKYKEAEAEYLLRKDKPIAEDSGAGLEEMMVDVSAPEAGPSTYREAYLQDLNDLERAGITHPDFSKIKALLEKK